MTSAMASEMTWISCFRSTPGLALIVLELLVAFVPGLRRLAESTRSSPGGTEEGDQSRAPSGSVWGRINCLLVCHRIFGASLVLRELLFCRARDSWRVSGLRQGTPAAYSEFPANRARAPADSLRGRRHEYRRRRRPCA